LEEPFCFYFSLSLYSYNIILLFSFGFVIGLIFSLSIVHGNNSAIKNLAWICSNKLKIVKEPNQILDGIFNAGTWLQDGELSLKLMLMVINTLITNNMKRE